MDFNPLVLLLDGTKSKKIEKYHIERLKLHGFMDFHPKI